MTGEIFSSESFLWSCLWQSTIFLVAGLLGSFLLRRHSARAHRVLFLAMIAAVIVPAASLLVNHYELGMFVTEPVVIQPPSESRAIHETTVALPEVVAEHSPAPISEDLQTVTTGSKDAKFPWAAALLYAWIAASLILAARLLVTFILGLRLLGRAQPLNSDIIEQAIHLAKTRLGISKDVKVYGSENIHSPVIWCWRRRPVLLLPSTAGRSDNGIDWAGVLCHELAHYKRRDHVAGLLAELTVCFLPWHPLLWWAKSHLISLSEQACDDWVVASGRPSTDYAESLLNLTPGGQMAFVPAVVRSKKGLAGRVHRILKDSCGNPRTGTAWALAACIVATFLTVGIAFAQTRPAKLKSTIEREDKSTTSLHHVTNGSLIKITGFVKDPQGHPVADTKVTLFQTTLDYVTDVEGKFTASLPPSDKMRYFFAVHKQRKLIASGRLAGGKRDLEINLVPAKIVSGRVLDPDGRPVAGAQVAPLPMTCFHVLTDSKGRFDVGWSPKWHAPDHELCLMVRHSELKLATVVDIAPEDKTIDIKLEPALALHGIVEDTNGRPVSGATVNLSLIKGWEAGTPVEDVIADYQGRFELPTLPQRQEYGIGANAKGYVSNAIRTGVINNIAEREEVGPVILGGAPLQREDKVGFGRLVINVADEDGRAVDIGSVLIWNKTDDGGSRGKRFSAVATDKQGFYEIRNIPVGKHQAISVDKEGFVRFKRFDIEVRDDSSDVIGCVLTRGGIIEGFVTDEQNNPVVGVRVVIIFSGLDTQNLTTDENGHFLATQVPDGRHSVYAHPPAGSPYEIEKVKGGVLCGTKDVHIVFKKREEAKNIRSAAGPGFEPKPAQTVNFDRRRVISFPEDRSMGNLFAGDSGEEIQETETISTEVVQDIAVNEGKVKLCLFDTSGKPVAGAKVGTSVRTRETAFLGSKLSWTLRGRENNVSNEQGEIELTRRNLFLDRWSPERKAALYVLHEERKIGAFCEISKNDLRGEIPLALKPVCHVHGRLSSEALKKISRPLTSTNVYMYRNKDSFGVLSHTSHNSKEYRFDFFVPHGRYTLDAYGGGEGVSTEHVHPEIEVKANQSELDMGVIDLPPTKLALLIGNPAPELGPIKAWKNGSPVKLAELRGKPVIIHFGGGYPSTSRDLPILTELHEEYVEAGLVIIGLYNCESMRQLEERFSEFSKEHGGEPDVPFRLAIDGGKSRIVEPTDWQVPGETYAAYDIKVYTTTILIDQKGNVVEQLNLGRARERIESMLSFTDESERPAWKLRFEQVYRLDGDEVLKRIAPPFIPERKGYFANERPSQAERNPEGPAMMIFHWRDNKANLSYTLDHNNFKLSNLVQYIFKIGTSDMWWGDTGNYSGNPDGPEQLIGMKLPGDWIIRNEAPPEVKIQALEKLIADQFGHNITIRSSIEQRDVIVATGQFKFSPVYSNDTIVMYADEDESVRKKCETILNGTNTIGQFLQHLEWLVSVPVIDKTKVVEDTRIEYRAHLSNPSIRRIKNMSEKKDKLRFFLNTLSKQTNLEFEITREPVEVWFVTEETEN